MRSMTKAMREAMAEQVDQMHKLSAVHAIPTMDVRNLDAKLKILDLILAGDPEAGPASTDSPTDTANPKSGSTTPANGNAASGKTSGEAPAAPARGE